MSSPFSAEKKDEFKGQELMQLLFRVAVQRKNWSKNTLCRKVLGCLQPSMAYPDLVKRNCFRVRRKKDGIE